MDRRDGKGLAELMAELGKLEGLEWMRILYAYPSYFSDELIDEIAHNPKVRQHLCSRLQPCVLQPWCSTYWRDLAPHHQGCDDPLQSMHFECGSVCTPVLIAAGGMVECCHRSAAQICMPTQVCKYIDIPLQHMSNLVLLGMNRPPQAHTADLLKKLRARIPGLVLRTTFISGFPGAQAGSSQLMNTFSRNLITPFLLCIVCYPFMCLHDLSHVYNSA